MQRPPQFPPVAPAESPAASAPAPQSSKSAPPPLLADEFLSPPAERKPSRTEDDVYARQRPPRSESAGWGLLIGAFGVATLLLAVAVGVLFVYRDRLQDQPEPDDVATETENEKDPAGIPGGNVATAVATQATGGKFVPSLSPQALEFCRETLAPYLLVARSDGPAGPKSAPGILADAAGHIAVPMSSVRGAEIVVVSSTIAGRETRLDDAVESPGAVAVDREADWLLIAAPPLPGAPIGALPRAFDKSPAKGDRLIVAGASERGSVQAFECEVREAPSAELIDDATRRALESRGWNVERFDWRRVGPVPASLRPGAGLFSLDGVWMGLVASRTPDGKELLVATGPELSAMFTSVGQPTPGFLRLDAGVAQAVASEDPAPPASGLASSDPAPGSSEESSSTETPTGAAAPMPSDVAEPSPFPIDDPAEAPTSEEAGWTAAAAELGELVGRLETKGLYAETLEEYLDLADLAENLTTNGKRVAAAPESARSAWEAERDRALELLATRPWGKDFEAAAHNEQAGTHVDSLKGIFFYGEVTAAKDEIKVSGDTQSILFQAIGRSDRYVVDMTKNSDEFVKGSKWIVVGLADPRMKISLRTSADDPGTVVPTVEAKYIVGRPDAASAKAPASTAKVGGAAGNATKRSEASKDDDSSKPEKAKEPGDSGEAESSPEPAVDPVEGDSP